MAAAAATGRNGSKTIISIMVINPRGDRKVPGACRRLGCLVHMCFGIAKKVLANESVDCGLDAGAVLGNMLLLLRREPKAM